MFKGISGNVLILGLVSFFTDVSSEMIYPLLPLFLTTVLGGGPAFLGLIEGVAESTASLLKLMSGIVSDRVRRRKNLVLAGYAISSVARPLIGAGRFSPGRALHPLCRPGGERDQDLAPRRPDRRLDRSGDEGESLRLPPLHGSCRRHCRAADRHSSSDLVRQRPADRLLAGRHSRGPWRSC